MPDAVLDTTPEDMAHATLDPSLAILPPRGREVATALVAMGRERAARVIARFSPHEIALLRELGASDGAARLPDVSADELAAIVGAFEDTFERGAGVVGAAPSFAALLAETAEPDAAPSAAEPDDPGATERRERWTAVAAAPDDDLSAWLAGENEAVAALAVARLPPERSATLLQALAPDTCAAIVAALPHLETGPETEDLVLDLLEGELAAGASDATERTQSLLAAIVNELDRATADTVTRTLAETLPEREMEGVNARIFRFEDVGRLDETARATLLGDVPAANVVQALAGADAGLREAVLSSLGQRMRRMIEAELDAGPPVPPDAARTARRDIAARALSLVGEGAFELPQAA